MSDSANTLEPASERAALSWRVLLGDSRIAALLVVILWAVAYLPGLGARDLRLEEGRRATPALEMKRSGNYVVPTLYGEIYHNKPPLYFWAIVAVSPLTGGVNELATRLPSALGALFGALFLLGFAPRSLTREMRAVAALAVLACPIMLDKATLGELDALVSTLTIGAVVLWWNGYEKTLDGSEAGRKAKQSLVSWIGAGICMGLAVLGKGPVCLAVFYLFVIPFMVFRQRGDLRGLLSAGHGVFVILSLAPGAVWVWALVDRGYLTYASAGDHWAGQMGVKALSGFGTSAWLGSKLRRYAWFVPETLVNVLPWSIWAMGMMWPKVAALVGYAGEEAEARKRALWRMLVLGSIALMGVFWAWPSAETRHLMMVSSPLAVLAAIFLVENSKLAQFAKLAWFVRWSTYLIALGPATGGVIALVFAMSWYKEGVGTGILALGSGMVITIFALLLTRRTHDHQISLAFACTVAVAILFGRGSFASVFLPYKAETDTTRILRGQIAAILPKGRPIFTTRCFSRPKSELYSKNQYNTQFYLPGGATALTDFAKLPRGGAVTVIVAPDEVDALRGALPTARVRELGRLEDARPGGTLPLVVLEVVR